MELDDLKQAWNKSDNAISHGNRNIIELIQNKSAGPAAKLKRRFKKGMILIPFILSIAVLKLTKHSGLLPQLLVWYLSMFGIAMMTYFYLNYRLINSMQTLEGSVKDNLQKQVKLLRIGLRWRLLITRGMFLTFIVLTELLMYFKIVPETENWRQYGLFLRLSIYAGSALFFYFLTKFATDFRYKKHILRLEELIEEMK